MQPFYSNAHKENVSPNHKILILFICITGILQMLRRFLADDMLHPSSILDYSIHSFPDYISRHTVIFRIRSLLAGHIHIVDRIIWNLRRLRLLFQIIPRTLHNKNRQIPALGQSFAGSLTHDLFAK